VEFDLVDVELQYYDDDSDMIRGYLCAIGDYDEECALCQAWDDQIFYWFENIEELQGWKDLKKDKSYNHEDFKVLDFYNIRKAV
jgi:hypothetical protein